MPQYKYSLVLATPRPASIPKVEAIAAIILVPNPRGLYCRTVPQLGQTVGFHLDAKNTFRYFCFDPQTGHLATIAP